MRFQLDSGSNCNLLGDGAATALCELDHSDPASRGSIGGISGRLPYDGIAVSSSSLGDSPPFSLAFLATPGGKNILSETVLHDDYGINVVRDPPHLLLPDGSRVPITRSRGLHYVDLGFHKYKRSQAPPGRPRPIASSAAVTSADDLALLWAARLDTDGEGLLRLSRATTGIGIDRLSARQREAIGANMPRALAQARHHPVHATPLAQRATEPAELLVVDGFGKHHAASPVDGAVYQFSAVDEYSSYGYIASGKTHTIDDWVVFLRTVVLDARAHGHNPRRVRFDRAPELATAELRQRLELELQLSVELTPREHHEGVGRAERNHDLLTRMAEAMLQRAELGTEWLLPARAYAQWLLNRRPLATGGETRYQKYFRRVPDLSAPVPYVFGTTVAIVEDVRGPKGSLDHPRGSIGQLVGVEGSSYLVYRGRRGNVVRQSGVRPLNEVALIQSGLAPHVATATVATQTPSVGWREAIPPAAAAAAPAPPSRSERAPPPTVDIELGARVEILWRERDGRRVWYSGKIHDSHTQANGRRRHHVAYDGWSEDQWFWHDLASDDHEWRRIRPGSSGAAPSADEAGGSADPGRYGLRPRRAAAATALAALDNALEASSGAANTDAALDAAIYQYFGDAAGLEGDLLDIDDRRAALYAAVTRHDAPILPIFCAAASREAAECNKATQNIVDIETAAGPQQLNVPSTYRQLMTSPQRDQWLAADQKALDAILAHPGNRLVAKSVPQAEGLPIAPCVTQRKVKVDQATGALEERNPFKSRHCVDGGRLDALLKRAAKATDNDTSSAVACDLLVKMTLADAALRDRNLTKADVPDAYPQGKRLQRPKTYMALPTAFASWRADDGAELCIELSTPLWGEGSAGFEWQVELESTLRKLGWRPAENVPALWLYSGADGDAHLITIVDDLLFSESKQSGYGISEKTIKLLSERYGDLRPEREPTSYAGIALRRDRAAGMINLSMPQKVIEAAREHYPELLTGASPDSPPPKGVAVRRLADALSLPSEKAGKLSRAQVRTQQLIGHLKWIERLHPRLSLICHRLSCVMSNPPQPESYDVARAALEAVYQERDVGLTYGGGGLSSQPVLEGVMGANIDLSEPAQAELAAHADATWGERNIYGLMLIFCGAAVVHQTKKINLIVDSSMETEAIASARAGETVTYAREILRALSLTPSGPTLISTDNLANQKVGSGLGCPTRSRHFLRRYNVLKQRIAQGDVTLRYIPDPQMPADFLTKWIPAAKLELSLQYATNSRALNRA